MLCVHHGIACVLTCLAIASNGRRIRVEQGGAHDEHGNAKRSLDSDSEPSALNNLRQLLLAFNPLLGWQGSLARREHCKTSTNSMANAARSIPALLAALQEREYTIISRLLHEDTHSLERQHSERQHIGFVDKPIKMDKVSSQATEGSKLEGSLLMLLVAFLWGSNFPAVKATMEAGVPGSVAAASRFSIAAIALLPLLQSEEPLPKSLVLGGFECGAWLSLGYIAQALALHDLPAGNVAFLASLQVVIVPLINTLFGSVITPRLILAAILCVGGVGLLESGGTSVADAQSASELTATFLALLQPVGFGMSYLRIEKMMKEYPEHGLHLSSLQLISNAAIAVAWCAFNAFSPGAEGTGFDFSVMQQLPVLGGLFYTGLISTALTVLLQTRALGMIPATDSSVIVATEPLWAAALATVMLGEVLDEGAQLGGLLILLGCLSNTLLPENLSLSEMQGKEDGSQASVHGQGTAKQD